MFPLTANAAAPAAGATWTFTESSPSETNVPYGGGTYSWDQSARKLTLNNVSHSTSANIAVRLPGGSKVVLKGKNTIKSTFKGADSTFGLKVDGNLTISGTGSLIATGGTTTVSNGFSQGIVAHAAGNITIKSGTITAKGGSAKGASGSMGIAAGGGGKILIKGGKVTATGGSASRVSEGFDSYTSISISGGTVVAKGGSAQFSWGIGATKSVKITGGNVTVTGKTSAVSRNVTVLKGFKYTVANNTAGKSPKKGTSSGSFKIKSTHKYAKVIAKK